MSRKIGIAALALQGCTAERERNEERLNTAAAVLDNLLFTATRQPTWTPLDIQSV